MSSDKISRVLHLSNITHNISRFDITDEIEKFCAIKQVFILRPNNQALVEMYSSKDAEFICNQFQNTVLLILGNEVGIKYSRHNQLVRPEDHTTPQCVLLVSIICRDNSTLPLRHFYSICLKHGLVDRIRMFIHQAGPQALVQYSHLYDCVCAKDELEKSTFVFGGRRYAFEVQFSKLKELMIHKNNNYSRDFNLFPLDVSERRESDARIDISESCLRRGLSQNSAEELETRSLSTSSLSSSENTVELDSFSSGNSSPREGQSLRCLQSDQNTLSMLRHAMPEEVACLFSRGEENQVSEWRSIPAWDTGCGTMSRHNVARDGSTQRCASNLPQSYDVFSRRDSELSSFSTNSLGLTVSDSMIGPHDDHLTLSLSSTIGLNSNMTSLFPTEEKAVRRYVLEGFARMVPISDLVDLLYGIDVKYAEYRSEYGPSYAVVIFGRSEWSDRMLASYLCSNPVEGRVIRLRGASEVVSYE